MIENICPIKVEYLNKCMKEIFGNKSEIKEIKKLTGGVQKSTYKIECITGEKAILHIWDISHEVFSEKHKDKNTDILITNSANLFKVNNEFMMKNNINTPKILKIDITKQLYPFEYAFVEYISNIDMWEIICSKDENRKERILNKLNEQLIKLHSHKRSKFGNLKNEKETAKSFEKIIYDQTINELDYLIANNREIKENQQKIMKTLNRMYENLKPRKEFTLVHGELAPNHILINEEDEVYFIDIEGMKYRDIEFEHSFLEFLFGENYRHIKSNKIDETRRIFYKYHLHLSFAYGHLKILREMKYEGSENLGEIVEYNIKEALKLLYKMKNLTSHNTRLADMPLLSASTKTQARC